MLSWPEDAFYNPPVVFEPSSQNASSRRPVNLIVVCHPLARWADLFPLWCCWFHISAVDFPLIAIVCIDGVEVFVTFNPLCINLAGSLNLPRPCTPRAVPHGAVTRIVSARCCWLSFFYLQITYSPRVLTRLTVRGGP